MPLNNHQQPLHRVPYMNYGQQQPPLLPDPPTAGHWSTHDFVLEHQFSQMSFTQPPPPFFQQQQQGPRPMLQPQQQNAQALKSRNNVGPPSMESGPGIPSLLDIHVPVPQHLSNNGPNPLRFAPQQQQIQRLPRTNFNTSVPPPRITLLQKPR